MKRIGREVVPPARDRRWFLKGSLALAAAGLPTLLARISGTERPAAKYAENPLGLVQLPCGRRLAYAEFGDPAGSHVVVHHHGYSSCRLEGEVFRDALHAQPGVRLFVVDRPGIGQSDPDPCGDFLSWPAGIAVFADALRIDRFAVMGVSGGAPYALSVARALPNRVTVVSLACPMAPLEAVDTTHSNGARGALFAQRHPVAARLAVRRFLAGVQRHPDRIAGSRITLGPPDRAQLADPAVRCLFSRVSHEALRQGPDEAVHAAALLAQPWACWLKDVQTKVTIFHGGCDQITAPPMARYLTATLPNAKAYYYPDEGHVSVPLKFAGEILAAALPAA